MKVNLKNIVNGMLLLMGILLSYNIYLQQTDNSPVFELSIKNDSTANFGDADSEINEDDQVVYALDFSAKFQKNNSRNHLYVVRSAPNPLFSVWQPPKI